MQVTADSAATTRLELSVFASLDVLLSPLAAQRSRVPQRMAVAVSGGADSMAMTLLAQAYVAAFAGEVTALTVDHRLRADSTAEAEQVAAWMRARNIPHHILTPEHSPISNNLQETARSWRYALLARWCRDHGVLHCLLAHQAGDNRETLMHQKGRDAATEQAGMAQLRHHQGVRFLRPLLSMERTQLEEYLRSKSQHWVEDPSNHNPRFARVRNRAQLAANHTLTAELDAQLLSQRTARHAHDAQLAQAAITCVSIHPLGYATLNLTRWRSLNTELATALLADCLATISGAKHRPRLHETKRLSEALQHTIKRRTLLRCELTQQDDVLLIAREPSRVEAPQLLAGRGTLRWDQRFVVHFDLPPGVSLTLRALGRDGRKQLGALARHLPLATPSLWHLDELLHVPYMDTHKPSSTVTIGFAPPKPLAGAPFW